MYILQMCILFQRSSKSIYSVEMEYIYMYIYVYYKF